MAAFINEHLVIPQEGNTDDIQMYLNDGGEIFVTSTDDFCNWFFLISKEDWDLIKEFIDTRFKE